MKNTSIFIVILLAIGTVAVLASKGSNKGYIEGQFASNIYGIDYKWAYLHPDGGDEILDSCQITGNRFTLSCGVRKKEFPCKISYSGFKGISEVVLRPRQTIQLAIQVSPTTLMDMIEERIERMIAQQAHADSIARMDSIRKLMRSAY